ncbi:MAG: hypothetical protein IJ241_00370 [Clostridia bacterium]|nr:hypothetical protein [Clostridia bacterium]
MKAFETGYKGLISGLFFVVALVLLLLSGSSTTFLIGDWTEKVFLTYDAAWRNVLCLALFAAALFFAGRASKVQAFIRRVNEEPDFYAKWQVGILGVGTLFAILWVYGNQIVPEQDQLYVMQAADRLNVGNYEDFQAGGYLSMYPNQTGLLLLELLLTKLFGGMNYVVFEAMNGEAYIATLLLLSALAGKLGADPFEKLLTMRAGLFTLPLLFYTSFQYGNLLGLALALGAMWFELRYLEKHNVWDLVLTVLLIVAASAVKNNYLIFLVAIVLHALAEALREKQVRNALLAVLVVAVYALQSWGTTAALEHRTGGDLSNGVSTMAFVAMGLQVNPVKCDGWYNEFNKESYIESGYDAAKQSELAKQSISDSVAYLKTPSNAGRFFLRKNASQWADPLFQSLWTSQVRQTQNERPGWLARVLSPKGSTALAQFLDVLQFWAYAGAVLYLIFGRKREGFFESLLLQITVLGGFVFHCVWEAKGQYTISYFVLLLPLAVLGFSECLSWIAEKVQNRDFGKEGKGDWWKTGILAAVLLLTVFLPLTHGFDCLSEGSAAFAAYLGG